MPLAIVEIIGWIVLTGAYTILGYLDLRDSRDNLDYLIAQKLDGARQALARMHIQLAESELAKSFGFMTIGIISLVAMFLPVAQPAVGVVFAVAMFSILGWSIWTKRGQRRERRALVHAEETLLGPDVPEPDWEDLIVGLGNQYRELVRSESELRREMVALTIEVAKLRSWKEKVQHEFPQLTDQIGWGT